MLIYQIDGGMVIQKRQRAGPRGIDANSFLLRVAKGNHANPVPFLHPGSLCSKEKYYIPPGYQTSGAVSEPLYFHVSMRLFSNALVGV